MQKHADVCNGYLPTELANEEERKMGCAERADRRLIESFDAEGDFDIVPRYDRAFSGRPHDPPRTRSAQTVLNHAMGAHPSVGTGPEHRLQNDQRTSGNGPDHSFVSRPVQIQRCLIPADGFYAWEPKRQDNAAILF
jgi:putative SOS response-associated peptidase YedK